MKNINTEIRKKIYGYQGPAVFEGSIYRHKENSGNNGDKFLINIKCESQNFMVGDGYNDEDYNLTLLKDQESIIFVICGNREISALLRFFNGIRMRNG